MSTLVDHVDRLTRLAQSIRSNASAVGHFAQEETTSDETVHSAGPFTRAVLETPLGNLIRDIDPSELGLFTLMPQRSAPTAHEGQVGPVTTQKAEVARVALPIATPLRKPPSGMQRREGGQRITEYDPEIYANAALKYLDRYQSIRPMPRFVEKAETLLEQITNVRENISQLNGKLKQLNVPDSSEGNVSPATIIKGEERRIAEVQAKIVSLRSQKESLLKQKTGPRIGLRAASKSKPKPAEPPAVTSPPDAQEEDFWNTPGAPARTLHFTGDLLTDEQLDLSDLDPSLTSPFPNAAAPGFPRPMRQSKAMQFTQRDISIVEEEPEQARNDVIDRSTSVGIDASDEEGDQSDQTVILPKQPASGPPPADPSKAARADRKVVQDPQPATQELDTPFDRPTKTRFKVTTELERIVSKVWVTIGDSVMPGHDFDVSGTGSEKPPRAKETIAHLQSIASQTPSPDSPSASSLSSLSLTQGGTTPLTAQQILTARILLALLSATPNYSMPLNTLKEALSKGDTGAGIGTVTRPIYACVAKRLLKIERGGGEQVVKFDI